MYRLACKIKHVELQDKAFAAIRSSLTEHNIIQELSSSLASRFPHILEMEVESLFQHVTTPTVKKDYPTLIKRIAGADLPHGADVLIQLHEKMLNQHYPRTVSSLSMPSPCMPSSEKFTFSVGELWPDLRSRLPDQDLVAGVTARPRPGGKKKGKKRQIVEEGM
ncbi:hypothetical protein AZE42_04081 [Rhizopogon vesiculosus]|uniref:Uncharacterized protein n=1 Tax=Rhizopogon vesiculosus TaxID=180088 RepID=A0A1J8QFV6_9AGAM|nr:hypothetical protein AZE42_04081 [Rhizopogon vesiculosus]